jgi:medium-chain acyl-[acyl-carrier-protein] hydrolase
MRWICLPHAGGSASMFFKWAGHLPADVEVLGVQLPGRGARLREPPFRRMEALIAALKEAILPLTGEPYAIFGHSCGGLVGFELARAMRRDGRPPPLHLVVSARRAPHLPQRTEPIHHLPQAAFIDALEQRYGIADRVLRDPEMAEMLVPPLQSDMEILETATHAVEEPLAVPLTAVGALGDRSVARSDLEGWQQHTAAGWALHMFEGDHFYPLRDPAPLMAILRGVAG